MTSGSRVTEAAAIAAARHMAVAAMQAVCRSDAIRVVDERHHAARPDSIGSGGAPRA